jgi:hypothetical protein
MVHGNMILDPDAIPDATTLARFYAQALVDLGHRLEVDEAAIPEALRAAAATSDAAATVA